MRSGFDSRAGCIGIVTIDFQVVMDGIRELHAAEVVVEDARCERMPHEQSVACLITSLVPQLGIPERFWT